MHKLSTCGRQATRQLCRRESFLTQVNTGSITDDSSPASSTDGRKAKRVQSPIADLLAQHAALEKSIKSRISSLAAEATKARRRQAKQDTEVNLTAPRVLPSAYQPHHDLASFLTYVEEFNMKTTTTVFKGTLYEYTVAEALKAYNMSLKRVGKSNDYGIDLLGHWTLPDSQALRVLVQCKMTKTMPSMIRELEGSYVGAPPGWQGDNVLALLASRHVATPGTQQAIQRSKWPLGFLQVDTEGVVKQFIWNTAASERGLSGVSVASKFATVDAGIKSSLALTWLGGAWPDVSQQSG